MTDTILAHWPWLVAIWFAVGAVTAMPSPKENSAGWYKWLYGTLHFTVGALPRLIVTLFPQYGKFIPGGSNGSQTNGSTKPSAPATPVP